MTVRILVGDVRERLAELPDESVHCVVTSPPYFGLRSYLDVGDVNKHREIGLEPTLAEYIDTMTAVFRDVRRVLRSDGVCWLNIGDSYAANRGTGDSPLVGRKQASNAGSLLGRLTVPDGLKPKDLMMVPARLALALQADGWWLRSDCIWHKPNPMPESVTDRPTNAHEHIFLLTKSARYWYDSDAVREQPADYERKGGTAAWTAGSGHTNGIGSSTFHQMNPNGANLRNVWSIATVGFPGAHFATFPPEIPRRCIKAGTSERGACAACGAPWSRVVERTAMEIRRSDWGEGAGTRTAASGTMTKPPTSQTLGWQPGCTCDADVIPCTVMDPFFGSGTTGLVADQLGRDCIGIELNPTYADIAEKRIRGDAPLIVELEVA